MDDPVDDIADNGRMRVRLALLTLLLAAPLHAATEGGAIPLPLPLFPGNNWWNIDISNAQVDYMSTLRRFSE